MLQKFSEKFDLKRFRIVTQLIFILACLFVIVNLLGKAYSRYESRVNVSAEANVALFLIEQGTYENTLSLTGLTPSSTPFYYTFNVTNFKDSLRCNVDLTYTIKFETTTNLPLTYEIVRNDTFTNPNYTNIIQSTTVRQDEYDVFYKVFSNNGTYSFSHTRNETDSYTLKVVFPESYKNQPDLYQGVIELFSIIIDATQVA